MSIFEKTYKSVCTAIMVFDMMILMMACSDRVRENFKKEPEVTVTVTTSETAVTGTSAVVTSRATTSGVTTSVTYFTTTEETAVTEPSSEVYVETVEEPVRVEYIYDIPVVENPVETVDYIPVTTESGIPVQVSDEERNYLIHVVHHETGNQSYFAKKAECSTVLNRCRMKCMSVLEVLTEPNQYSMDYSDLYYCEECAEAVDDVLENGVNVPEDVIYAFASYCDNSWLWSREIYCIDGECVFAR